MTRDELLAAIRYNEAEFAALDKAAVEMHQKADDLRQVIDGQKAAIYPKYRIPSEMLRNILVHPPHSDPSDLFSADKSSA